MPAAPLHFWLNDRLVEVEAVDGTTTLLRYLRDHLRETGTKEGCAEGDCGACTVAMVERRDDGRATFRAVNSCLLFLPMLQGKRVYTVEGLRSREPGQRGAAEGLHPAQAAMVSCRGSQCGYCTPGIVMSLFEATYRDDMGEAWQIDDQLCGNLCRCTGYRPIREAGEEVAGSRPDDRFAVELRQHRPASAAVTHHSRHQNYLNPESIEDALALRAAHPEARVVAGGTDLGLAVTQRHEHFPMVIGLEGVDSLKALRAHPGGWTVGAAVSLTRLHEVIGPELPAFDKLMRVFGSRQVRSRATLGGNLCNASPIGDSAPLLLALGASVVLASVRGERRVALSEFFLGYRKTALAPDELLVEIEVPRPGAEDFVAFYKISKRREMDISAVAAGMRVRLDAEGRVAQAVLAYGGMAATPKRAEAAERALIGQPWCEATVEAASAALSTDFSPLSDHRGSAEFRRVAARNLLRGFFLESGRADRDRVPARPTATVHLAPASEVL